MCALHVGRERSMRAKPRTVQYSACCLVTDLGWLAGLVEGLEYEGALPDFTFDVGSSVHEIDADGPHIFVPHFE